MISALEKVPVWLQAQWGKRSKRWLYAVTAVLVVFLFTHQRNDTGCNHNVTVYGVIELQFNCDTNSVYGRIDDLSRLFTDYHNWKGRPIYLASGILMGQAMMPIVQPLWRLFAKNWTQMKRGIKALNKNIQTHFAFIILNILVVVWAARTAIKISGLEIQSYNAVILAAAIASMDIVQAAVFSFHTNVFNIVGVLGAALYALLGMSSRSQTVAHVSVLGFLVGAGILVYPIIAILAPAYLVGNIYGRIRWPSFSLSWPELASRYVIFSLSAIALPLLWYVFVTKVMATKVYLSADYGQFVWLLDAYREGNLASELIAHAKKFIGTVKRSLGIEGVLVLLGVGILAVRGGRRFWIEWQSPLVFCLLISALGILSFNFLQGYYATRLHIGILLLGYILIARLSWAINMQKTGGLILLGIVSYQMVNAVMYTAISL